LLGEANLEHVNNELSLKKLDALLSPGDLLLKNKSLLGIKATLGELGAELGELEFSLEELNTEASAAEACVDPDNIVAVLGVSLAVLDASNLQLGLEDFYLVYLVALLPLGSNTTVSGSSSGKALGTLFAGSLELGLNGLEFLLGSLELLHEGSSLIGSEAGGSKLGLELGDAELQPQKPELEHSDGAEPAGAREDRCVSGSSSDIGLSI